MVEQEYVSATTIERSCAVTAVALSEQRREGARLMTGANRSFGLSASLGVVHVPVPARSRAIGRDRTLTCGVALQCSPSKDRLARYRLNDLSARELRALTLVEAGVALGWIASRWPGLIAEMRRMLPDLEIGDGDMEPTAMLDRAIEFAAHANPWPSIRCWARLPSPFSPSRTCVRLCGDTAGCPGPATRSAVLDRYSVPVGGDGGVRNPNLPPPSRPEDNDLDVSSGTSARAPLS